MTTTSLKMDEALKRRVTALAERKAVSPHALMLQAIEAHIEDAEIEQEFEDLCETRWAKFLKTGRSISMQDMESYVKDLVDGKTPKRPKATAWPK
jgi:predicted transcriptional regulator